MMPPSPKPTDGPTLSFDPVLVQRVVDLEMWRRESGDLWARRYREACEELYHLESGRRERFAALALVAFDELGHIAGVRHCLGPMARLHGGERTLRFLLARDRGAEGADFLNRPSIAPLSEATIAVRPERFVDGTLRPFLLVELEHLEEILDPAFGYDPAPALPGISPNARRMVMGRLQELWDQHARAMLACRGLADPDAPGSTPAAATDPATTFPELVQLACRGAAGPRRDQGAPCPLCGFPTSDWADAREIAAAAGAIASDFPSWSSEDGACRRCLESFALTQASTGGRS